MAEKRIKENYELTIQPLTAVSISRGSELDYASYIINSAGYVSVIDIDRLAKRVMTSASDALKHKLIVALDNSSIGLSELKRFVAENCRPEDVVYKSGLERQLRKRLETAEGNLNMVEIYRCMINGNMVPVIPGSSVKGAVRTAFTGQACVSADVFSNEAYEAFKNNIARLSEKNENDKSILREAKRIGEDIDASILFSKTNANEKEWNGSNPKGKDNIRKSPNSSAMRWLNISDLSCENSQTMFASFSMPGRRTMRKALPPMDVITGSLLDSNAVFKGSLNIMNVNDIAYPLTAESVLDSCNKFAVKTFNQEAENIINTLRKRESQYSFDIYDELASIVNGYRKDGEFLLRLGRYSHREFMTYSNDFRYVNEKNQKNEMNPKWGTTRTMMIYSHDVVPMGWCLCQLKKCKKPD